MLSVYIFGLVAWGFLMLLEVAVGESNRQRIYLQLALGLVWPLYIVFSVVFFGYLAFRGGDDAKS